LPLPLLHNQNQRKKKKKVTKGKTKEKAAHTQGGFDFWGLGAKLGGEKDKSHGVHEMGDRAKWRIELGEWLEGSRVQGIMAILLLLDVFCVVVELLIGADIIRNDTAAAHHTEQALHIISLCILSLFAVEVSLLVVSFGKEFFKHPWYILDFVVIFLSIILDASMHSDEAELLLILRLWRVVRIIHGIHTYREIEHKEKEQLHRKVEHLEQKVEDDGAYIAELEKKLGIPPRKKHDEDEEIEIEENDHKHHKTGKKETN